MSALADLRGVDSETLAKINVLGADAALGDCQGELSAGNPEDAALNITERNAMHAAIARGQVEGRTSAEIMRSAVQNWRRTDFDDTGWERRIENVPHPHARLITVLLWIMVPTLVAIAYWNLS